MKDYSLRFNAYKTVIRDFYLLPTIHVDVNADHVGDYSITIAFLWFVVVATLSDDMFIPF